MYGTFQFRRSWKSFQTPTEDYLFVERPPDDYFCPVTFNLLLKPNLTLCCGKHLSEECATRIQGEGGPCPLCKASDWSTVLNKHFYHKVNSLHVFCRHYEKGCWWKGALTGFEHHLQLCPFRLLSFFVFESYIITQSLGCWRIPHRYICPNYLWFF